MPWKIRIFFYLSLGFSLCGLIFPTHVTQAIGWDIGDMVHWVYGFFILFPRNPVGEPRFCFGLQIQGLFLVVCAFFLVVVSFIELRNAKLGNRYDKNLIYKIAIIQLIASQFLELSGYIVMRLSSFGFIFSAIFALIGNKELKLFYIDKSIVNARKERILGVVLITISFVYTISMVLSFAVPFGLDIFSLSFATNVFPGLILLITTLFYGFYLLIRANKRVKS